MAIKRFKSFVSEAASGGRPNDNTEKDVLEPRAKGEQDFKAKHKMTVTKHPVAGDHQFDGDRAEITEEKYLNQKGTGESDDGYADAGLFDKSKADKLAKKHKGKAVKDSGGKFLVQLGEEAVEVSDLAEGKVVDQLNDIVKTKSAKKVKFGNGKSETIDMTTASALVNMLNKLNPANSAKAEKMLEKSPEGMFQLVNIAFGGKS
jgi:hypothetical protein